MSRRRPAAESSTACGMRTDESGILPQIVGAMLKTALFLAMLSISALVPKAWGAALTYTYDSLNRLTRIDYDNGAFTEYTYDAAGNRLTLNRGMVSADLSVTKTGTPDPVLVGQNLTYTLTVTNAGPAPAAGVTLTDPLPAGVTFSSVSASQGSCTGTATVSCALGNLASAAAATVSIVVRPTNSGNLTNSASVAATTADPNSGNNSASVTSTVRATGVDLVETAVSNPPASLALGASFAVSDTVKNLGLTAAGASVTRYYLSTDALRDAGDVLLSGSRAVPGLAPMGTSSGSASVALPATITGGSYYLIACADDTKLIVEGNETNNCLASQGQVQGSARISSSAPSPCRAVRSRRRSR